MPTLWTWLKDAKYAGKHKIGDATYDQWALTISGVTLTVSVGETAPNRVFYYQRRSSTDHFEIHFMVWETRKPNATWFDVPHECKNGTTLEVEESKESPLVMLGAMEGVCEAAANAATSFAKQQCTNVYGGNGPCGGVSGLDADGIIAKSFALAGLFVPRTTRLLQEGGGGCVGGARRGDVLFVGSPATHVAMYLGGGMIAECPTSGENCRLSQVTGAFDGCRRYC